jgi:Protein of unknown function (DUF692)
MRDIPDGVRVVDFFEAHAENDMGAGGPPHQLLARIRADYPISMHGVGLSIGGAQPLDRDHLARLKVLIGRYQPVVFSTLPGQRTTASLSQRSSTAALQQRIAAAGLRAHRPGSMCTRYAHAA